MRSSKIERLIIIKLERYFKVKVEKQFKLQGKYYDFKFGNNLVELDGVYYHRTPKQLYNDRLKDTIAERFGYKIHRIKMAISDSDAIITANLKLLNEIFKG